MNIYFYPTLIVQNTKTSQSNLDFVQIIKLLDVVTEP